MHLVYASCFPGVRGAETRVLQHCYRAKVPDLRAGIVVEYFHIVVNAACDTCLHAAPSKMMLSNLQDASIRIVNVHETSSNRNLSKMLPWRVGTSLLPKTCRMAGHHQC